MNAEEAKTLLQQAVFGACEDVFGRLVQAGLISGTPEELSGKVSAFAAHLLAGRWIGQGSAVPAWDVAPVGPNENSPIPTWRQRLAFMQEALVDCAPGEQASVLRSIEESVAMINKLAGYTPKAK